jgi:hypothetical protein
VFKATIVDKVRALTETAYQEPIIITAEPEQLSEPKIKQKNIIILDVGSGPADGKHMYFNHEDAVHVDIKKNSFHLEVQCDAQFLPFRGWLLRLRSPKPHFRARGFSVSGYA